MGMYEASKRITARMLQVYYKYRNASLMHTRRLAAALKLGDPCSFPPPKLSYFNKVHAEHYVRRSKAATAKYIPSFVT